MFWMLNDRFCGVADKNLARSSVLQGRYSADHLVLIGPMEISVKRERPLLC